MRRLSACKLMTQSNLNVEFQLGLVLRSNYEGFEKRYKCAKTKTVQTYKFEQASFLATGHSKGEKNEF